MKLGIDDLDISFQYYYKAALQLRNKYYNECNMTTIDAGLELIGDFNANADNTTAGKLACIKDAIDKVMEENGLEDEWSEYQLELIVVLTALDQCNEIEDTAEAQK